MKKQAGECSPDSRFLNSCKPDSCSLDSVHGKYERITRFLINRGATISTMESCTSGQVASFLTDTEGASAILKGAFVTYSNEAKIREGVPAEVIDTYGVYSEETAAAMAEACRAAYGADTGIGVTGSFGNPDPNNADSVPGEVYFAFAGKAPGESSGSGAKNTDSDERSPGSTVKSFHCTIPVQPSRFQYKLFMADLIADRLMEYLGVPEYARENQE